MTLRTVIGTLPALASWGDGTRNVTINYPVPQGAEGSESNGFTVKPNAVRRPRRAANDLAAAALRGGGLG